MKAILLFFSRRQYGEHILRNGSVKYGYENNVYIKIPNDYGRDKASRHFGRDSFRSPPVPARCPGSRENHL